MCYQESRILQFNQLVDLYLLQKKYQVKESTYSHYCWLANTHIRPYLGDFEIDDIDSITIENFISFQIFKGRVNKDGGMSSKSVKDILSLLKSIIKYGYEKKLVKDNVISSVHAPKVIKKQIEIFSEEERNIIENKAISSSDLYFGICLSLYTGLRLGELCALKWGDIDMELKCLHVNRTISRIIDIDSSEKRTKIIIDSPKSISSQRTIPIPQKIENCLIKRNPYNNNLYFLTGTEKYIEPRNYYEKYKKFLQMCGVEQHTFHALRHSFATNCIEKGFDAKVLSEILGHADVKITLERYVHPSLDRKRQCMNLL